MFKFVNGYAWLAQVLTNSSTSSHNWSSAKFYMWMSKDYRSIKVRYPSVKTFRQLGGATGGSRCLLVDVNWVCEVTM